MKASHDTWLTEQFASGLIACSGAVEQPNRNVDAETGEFRGTFSQSYWELDHRDRSGERWEFDLEGDPSRVIPIDACHEHLDYPISASRHNPRLSAPFSHDRHIEFRIVLLYIFHAVLCPELFDHRLHSLRSSYGSGSEFRCHASRIDANRGVLEHVLVPLRFRALHGQKVNLLTFQDEPDRDRDRPPGLPPDHADLDLAVAGEAVFQRVFLSWHLVTPYLTLDPATLRR